MIPDTVKYKNQSIIKIEGKDKEGETVAISSNSQLAFSLDTAGVNYGKFLFKKEKYENNLTVQYSDLDTVRYTAEGKNPINLTPREVNIPVKLCEDENVKGSGKCWVHCIIEPQDYNQYGETWSDQTYDSIDATIASKGCALTCEAMVMTSYGDNIEPGKLNTWMKDPKRSSFYEGAYYAHGRVSWYAIDKHYPGRMKMNPHLYEIQIWDKDSKSYKFTKASNTSDLDEPISKCQLVIVSVWNSTESHFVVVTGKKGNRYTINDPGPLEHEYLDQYGDFWSYIIVKKNGE
jgi:hypothetical protein